MTPQKPDLSEPEWDPIDEASWESFPASDPPAISPATVERLRAQADARAEHFDDAERRALHEALERAYEARAATDQLAHSLGSPPPLLELRRSQAEQVAALEAEFEVRGLELPKNVWADRSDRSTRAPATVEAIMNTAVAAERAAAEAYEALALAGGPGEALARRSRTEHLPMLARARQR